MYSSRVISAALALASIAVGAPTSFTNTSTTATPVSNNSSVAFYDVDPTTNSSYAKDPASVALALAAAGWTNPDYSNDDLVPYWELPACHAKCWDSEAHLINKSPARIRPISLPHILYYRILANVLQR
ncbi:hypothetical protein F5Y15DRAFT_226048 [Xylariaceae sp. FL0016]|nr:hypothetical protein F5Y15DRAFT_226048 [Xylariaceae sp. FL0016]